MTRARPPILVALASAFGALLFCSPAFAVAPRHYSCQITASSIPSPSECNGTGNTVPGGAFANPWGLAVDNADNLWVADPGHGVVDKFRSSGEFEAQGTGPPGGFPAAGLYVRDLAFSDVAGRLFVADSAADDLWGLNPDASYANTDLTGSWDTEPHHGCCFIADAADNSGGEANGDLYVSANQRGVYRIDDEGNPAPFSAAAPYIGGEHHDQLTGAPTAAGGEVLPFGNPQGLAVDTSGDLYVVDETRDLVDEFEPSGAFVQRFTGTPTGPGGELVRFAAISAVASDPTNGDVLIADPTKHEIDEFSSSGEYKSRLTGTPTGEEEAEVPFGNPQGLAVDSHGHLYVSDGSTRTVDVFGPTAILPRPTYKPPSGFTPTSVTLHGFANTNGGGEITECNFEYGATSAYGNQVPCSPPTPYLESGPIELSAELPGLTGGTEYHYSLVLTNANGIAKGSDQTFIIPLPSIDSLSATEIGTTYATLRAELNPRGNPTTYRFQYVDEASFQENLASGGDGFAHAISVPESEADIGSGSADQSVDQAVTGLQPALTYHYRVFATNVYGTALGPVKTFTTFTPSGPLALPDNRAYEQVTPVDKNGANPSGQKNIIQASLSGDRVTFFSTSGFPGGTGAQEFPIFLATRSSDAWTSQGLLPPASAGPIANVDGWSEDLSVAFDTAEAASGDSVGFYLRDNTSGALQEIASGAPNHRTYHLDGTSADDSRVLFEEQVGGEDNLYLWDRSSGKLTLVAPDAFAGPYDWQTGNTSSGGGARGYYTQNAISADGSHVFYTTAGDGHIFMWENGHTVPISTSVSSDPAIFNSATPDGSYAFFTLDGDLHRFDAATGQSTDLTPGAQVLGVLGASDDASYVYFAATAALASGAEPGRPNLYLSHDGTTSFIAVLDTSSPPSNIDSTDALDWAPSTQEGSQLVAKTARLTPDGHTLLFRSQRRLTSYDNVGPTCDFDPRTGHSVPGNCTEFYRYDATSGQLRCVSCNPTGAAPTGNDSLQSIHPPFAAPGGTESILTRNLSDDGNRVFFETTDALVPHDTNNTQDVYEWEADGTGSCHETSQGGGCLYLLSTGQSPDSASFADASASGNDAFLFTSQALVVQDTDTATDVYDARVGGGIPGQNPSPLAPCVGDACQGPATAPDDPTPASSGFNGPANPLPVFKHRHRHHPGRKHHRHSHRATHANRGGFQ